MKRDKKVYIMLVALAGAMAAGGTASAVKHRSKKKHRFSIRKR